MGICMNIEWLTRIVGINIREAKSDTCLPTGGGADGQQPVGVLKGEQVGKYSWTYYCPLSIHTPLTTRIIYRKIKRANY